MPTLQQPAITGYRQLNATEAALMNDIKAHGMATQALIERVRAHLAAQSVAAEIDASDGRGEADEDRILAAEPQRWVAMARTEMQTALMKLVRAVAQPGGF